MVKIERVKMENEDEKKEIVEVEISYSMIDDDVRAMSSDKRKIDINGLLARTMNLFKLGTDLKRVIDPNVEYVVKFPAELLKKMGKHDIQFLKDKATGELLPTLYDYTDKGFGGQVRLVTKGNVTGQEWTNLASSVNNLIEQARYDNLIEVIQNVYESSRRIEKGQDDDRFAQISAGKQLVLNAMSTKDSEKQQHMLMHAVQTLMVGCEQVQATLITKMDNLPEVPESFFKQVLFIFSNPDNRGNVIQKYEDIQVYFSHYCRALELLAYAYTAQGEPQMIENLLDSTGKVFGHKNIELLTKMEPLLRERDYTGLWYKDPLNIEQKIIESFKQSEEDNDKFITVSGQELMEVIESVGNGREEGTKTEEK
ncbi:hypothetical protein M2145_001024 [Lachnospiraceae bacterium PF1-21]|uniref:hypothetical protein n=1 Tax=Ohessyouella blattaphilus TaxID=2949333 RepID=UPI003E31C110